MIESHESQIFKVIHVIDYNSNFSNLALYSFKVDSTIPIIFITYLFCISVISYVNCAIRGAPNSNISFIFAARKYVESFPVKLYASVQRLDCSVFFHIFL